MEFFETVPYLQVFVLQVSDRGYPGFFIFREKGHFSKIMYFKGTREIIYGNREHGKTTLGNKAKWSHFRRCPVISKDDQGSQCQYIIIISLAN